MSDSLDILQLNVVMLGEGILCDPQEQQAFDERMATETVFARPPQGMEVLPITLAMNRERIRAELSKERFSITKEYPTIDDVRRLAEIVRDVVECTKQWPDLVAIGYNFQVVYDLEQNAYSQLARHLFSSTMPAASNWKLIGGSSILKFSDDREHLWTLTVDSRFGKPDTSKVFLDTNCQINTPLPPTVSVVAEHLEIVWREGVAFVKGLGQ